MNHTQLRELVMARKGDQLLQDKNKLTLIKYLMQSDADRVNEMV